MDQLWDPITIPRSHSVAPIALAQHPLHEAAIVEQLIGRGRGHLAVPPGSPVTETRARRPLHQGNMPSSLPYRDTALAKSTPIADGEPGGFEPNFALKIPDGALHLGSWTWSALPRSERHVLHCKKGLL